MSFPWLLKAALRARRGKRFRPPTAAFECEREKELWQLRHELATKNYRPGAYHTFHIHEPKKRLISAAPDRDGVVHHALVGILEPIFERSFIGDSYACRKGKGTHAAADRADVQSPGRRPVPAPARGSGRRKGWPGGSGWPQGPKAPPGRLHQLLDHLVYPPPQIEECSIPPLLVISAPVFRHRNCHVTRRALAGATIHSFEPSANGKDPCNEWQFGYTLTGTPRPVAGERAVEEASQSRTVRSAAEGHDLAERPPTPEKLFAEYAPRVYHLARRMLGNAADAEEVTQDVFLQVVRKLATFRGEAAFSTWLYRVTVNAALGYRRKRARRQMAPLPEPLEDFREDGYHRVPVRPWLRTAADQALAREAQHVIEEAIAGLPEVYRDVYVLADVEELANADIGEMLDLSVPAVKSRLHRARLLMRKALAPYFEEQAA